MDLSDFMFGAAAGFAVMAVWATYLSRQDHNEWCSICDRQQELLRRQQATIEELRKRRDSDPADYWKDN